VQCVVNQWFKIYIDKMKKILVLKIALTKKVVSLQSEIFGRFKVKIN